MSFEPPTSARPRPKSSPQRSGPLVPTLIILEEIVHGGAAKGALIMTPEQQAEVEKRIEGHPQFSTK